MSKRKDNVIRHKNDIASDRKKWIRKNKYYYKNLTKLLKFSIPEGSSIIEIGCGIGNLINDLKPSRGVGIDISDKMIAIAKTEYPQYEFIVMDSEEISITEKFDFIIISDTVGYFDDVQRSFEQIQNLCSEHTRIIVTYVNFLWLPVLDLAELLRLKMPQVRNNWLNIDDLKNLLNLSGYDVIKSGRKFLMPFYIPLLSAFVNNYIANLPLINRLCLIEFIISRKIINEVQEKTVSVVIPARNEKGNIETIIQRVPQMGSNTEIIFVEGNSTDDTYDEIKRVCEKYSQSHDLKYFKQEGKGKADAVRKGFENVNGDILMILDADMTVPPEDLTKFYNAFVQRKGEYLSGTRLVYPLEKESMRTLNILGNKFFSLMLTWILNQKIKDTLCGTKVISRENYIKLKEVKNNFLGNADPFGDFDLILGASKLNLKYAEIPIRYDARIYGETNISRFSHGWMLMRLTLFAMNKFKFI
ncbi:MAG TPA: glycosyltransferase [Ignavibacteria bacterium]|nr:glycosyltransferase [Ignavibacteria bacterium]HQY53562.1 glycosyltransferase [Ignavibacteria bacterium]HRB01624.1 glycosyltransferase [Ignavibacteria bacterium]